MKTITQEHGKYILTISENEYLDFKVGDKYLHTGNIDGYKVIRNKREADLANRKILPKYYFEWCGNKHLVLDIKPKYIKQEWV